HLDDSIRHLRAFVQNSQSKEETAPQSPTSRSLPDAVEQLARRLIEEALRNSGGNKQKAAQVLGLSRQGLIKKLKRLGMGEPANNLNPPSKEQRTLVNAAALRHDFIGKQVLQAELVKVNQGQLAAQVSMALPSTPSGGRATPVFVTESVL